MPSAQEYREDGDVNDFSCYITIQNNSDSDLLLADFGIEGRYGVWPLYQPLNTIEAKSAGRVHLKDPIGQLSAFKSQLCLCHCSLLKQRMAVLKAGYCMKSRLRIESSSSN